MLAHRSRVAILPHDQRLGFMPGRFPLDRLIWPLNTPDSLVGRTIADLSPRDHLLIFANDTMHLRPSFGTKAKVSVMLLEPAAIHGHHMRMLRLTWRRFHRVLTCNEELLANIPNGIRFPFGGKWVPGPAKPDIVKTQDCSLIASAKTALEGHKLRHAIAAHIKGEGLPVDVMGGGYKAFSKKSDGLLPYRYSVVIENVRERNYFTEKLIDAVLCLTVPIYWGCPNIGDFLDTSGMIICENRADIENALRNMSQNDYSARRPHLEALQGITDDYGNVLERAANALIGCS